MLTQLAVITLLCNLAPIPSTLPTTTKSEIKIPAWMARAQAEADCAKLPRRTLDSIDQVLKFSRVGPQLMIQPVTEELPQTTRLLIGGINAIVTLNTRPAFIKTGNAMRDFSYIQSEFTGDGDESTDSITSISMAGGHMLIAREVETADTVKSVQFVCDPSPADSEPGSSSVRLMVSLRGSPDATKDFAFTRVAGTFSELRQRFPRDVDEFFRPILRDFGQESILFDADPRIAWQVLMDDWQPDAELVANVNKIVAQLDVDDAQQRESAQNSLKQIGQRAAIVLLRMDRAKLSAETQSAVDSMLEPYIQMTAEDAKKMRNSRPFLLDTLSSDQPVLRKLAWRRFKELTNTTATFDPDADSKTRSDMIAKITEATKEK